jgi:hypothetical protein
MRVLLDTHILLWAAAGSPALSEQARQVLVSDAAELFFSAASIWEVAIKPAWAELTLRSILDRSGEGCCPTGTLNCLSPVNMASRSAHCPMFTKTRLTAS